MIRVEPWGDNEARVACVAQLVKGVDGDGPLAKQLLELNGHLRFAIQTHVVFFHSVIMRDGETRCLG